MKPLCIYHGGCDDGFGSAYIVNRFLNGEVDLHYGIYQTEPPDCTDRDVYIVDFSYPYDVLMEIGRQAKTITVIDHHKSAEADLKRISPFSVDCKEPGYNMSREGAFAECQLQNCPVTIAACFDMDRSGVGLTWAHFAPKGEPMPWLFEYIQDRDLWRKQLPNCDQIIMALRSYPQEFEVWQEILDNGPDALLAEGNAIHRYYRTIVDDLKRNAVPQVIAGVEVPVVNSPYHFASELAGELAQDAPFAACYWNHAHGTTYSLRSRGDGMDVSEVAKQYGGGGHAGAAGFKVPVPLS